MRSGRIAVALLALLTMPSAWLAQTIGQGNACERDSECRPGRVCLASACAPSPTASGSIGASCKGDIECAGSLVCEQWKCVDLNVLIPSSLPATSAAPPGSSSVGAIIEICAMFDLPPIVNMGTPAPAEQNFVNQLSFRIGVLSVPRVQQAPGINNAIATVIMGHRVILFDPQFLATLRSATSSHWSDLAVLAHEFGHHLNGHITAHPTTTNEAWNRELEADYYSGFALAAYGASKVDALSATEGMSNLPGATAGSLSHPPVDMRKTKVLAGWTDQMSTKVTASAPTPSQVHSPSPAPPRQLPAQPQSFPVQPQPLPPMGRVCAAPPFGRCPMPAFGVIGGGCACFSFFGPVFGTIVP